MDNSVTVQRGPQAADDYESMIEQLLSEMKTLNDQMLDSRVDIDRLRAESSTLKAETRALLSGMGAQL